MPKSRNRGGHKGATRQVLKKSRTVEAKIAVLLRIAQELAMTGNQHAQVINAQRDKIAKLELHIQLLEEKVYATLTPEERGRLADILDPQPAEAEVIAPAVPENLEPATAASDVVDAELVDPAA